MKLILNYCYALITLKPLAKVESIHLQFGRAKQQWTLTLEWIKVHNKELWNLAKWWESDTQSQRVIMKSKL